MAILIWQGLRQKMLFIFCLMSIMIFRLQPLSTSWAANSYVGNISLIEGNVNIEKADGSGVIAAKTGDALIIGDIITTDSNSKAQISLNDNSTIYLAPKSRFQLKSYILMQAEEKRQVVVKAFIGKMRFIVMKIFKLSASGAQRPWNNSNFTVETPTAVSGVKGTDFAIEVSPTDTTIAVFEGRVGVRNISSLIKGEVILSANQMSAVKRNVPPKPPVSISPQQKHRLIQETTPAIIAQKHDKKEGATTPRMGKEAVKGTKDIRNDEREKEERKDGQKHKNIGEDEKMGKRKKIKKPEESEKPEKHGRHGR